MAGPEQSQFLERNHYHLFPQASSQLKSYHPISDRARSIPMTHVSYHRDLVLPMTFYHLKRPLGVRMFDDSHLVVYLRDPTYLYKPCLSPSLLGLIRAGHLDSIMMNLEYRSDRLVGWSIFKRGQIDPHRRFL